MSCLTKKSCVCHKNEKRTKLNSVDFKEAGLALASSRNSSTWWALKLEYQNNIKNSNFHLKINTKNIKAILTSYCLQPIFFTGSAGSEKKVNPSLYQTWTHHDVISNTGWANLEQKPPSKHAQTNEWLITSTFATKRAEELEHLTLAVFFAPHCISKLFN